MTRMCDVCGIRPAVGTVRRIRPGQPPEIEYLCEVHLAERRMGAAGSGLGGSGFGGLGLFDDFFSRFFGDSEDRPGAAGGRPAERPGRGVEQIDVTQRFSNATRELLQRAAQTAVDWGSLDLDTEHLLRAALQDDVV